MTSNELKEVLQKHYIWLTTSTNEGRANLSNAYLRGANLSDADLRGADLCDADLSGAYLSGADLCGADLCGADLSGADLRGANLSDANLSDANLSCADLSDANLSRVKANESTAGFWPVCPEEGSLVGWKKCRNNVIVKLLIQEYAKRSSATTRKCRCDKALVLDVFGDDEGVSQQDSTFIYKKGETVWINDFDENRWNECSTGIHFFITRAEAERY